MAPPPSLEPLLFSLLARIARGVAAGVRHLRAAYRYGFSSPTCTTSVIFSPSAPKLIDALRLSLP